MKCPVAAQQGEREADRVQRVEQVVLREFRVAEPVASGGAQDKKPGAQYGCGQQEPGGVPELSLEKKPGAEETRGREARFLHQDERDAGEGGVAVAVLQEEQQGEQGEAHRRHVELGQHRLGEEQGREAEHRERGEGRRARGFASKFDGEQEGDERAKGGQQQHRDPGVGNGETDEVPERGQIRHHAGRMDVRQGGVRNDGAGVVEIERGRDELAGFVPVKRDLQQRTMGKHHEHREQQVDQRVGLPAHRRAGAKFASKTSRGLGTNEFRSSLIE